MDEISLIVYDDHPRTPLTASQRKTVNKFADRWLPNVGSMGKFHEGDLMERLMSDDKGD